MTHTVVLVWQQHAASVLNAAYQRYQLSVMTLVRFNQPGLAP